MYGVEPEQIVSSFSGAVSGDFAVGGMSGYDVINQEIEFQWQKLQLALTEKASILLEEVNYEIPSVTNGLFFKPGLTSIVDSMEVWLVDRCTTICGKESFKGCETACNLDYNIREDMLGGIKKLVLDTDYSYTENNIYELSQSIDSDECYLVISYKVDSLATSYIPSLASILRDMVCANLGNRLFANIEGGKWSIVEHYEMQAERWLSMLKDGWVPPEIKKLNLMFKSGVKSIKIQRA